MAPDHTLPRAGYSIRVSPDGLQVRSADPEGSRAARNTLAQLHTQYGPLLPHLVIEDAPGLPNRGVMLDISRTRIPLQTELTTLVEQFASLKLNHLQLYTEHAFSYAGFDEVWGGSEPVTADEARDLDEHCQAHGIELAANQNCFGHLYRWLRTDRFEHLAETHGEWDFLGMPRSGPFSLCPTDERSLEFVRDRLDELLPCFTSRLVNIGCDETHDVGQGRSARAVKQHGRAKVYGRFVSQICEMVKQQGRRPMMWGDIAAEHPEVVSMLPAETIGLVWGYEPASDFASMGRVWQEAGKSWWACPGTSSWRSYTGRAAERQANIRRAAVEGIAGGAQGLLVTDWGDVGHHQSWPIALMGIAETADAAWTGTTRHESFLDAVSLHVFGDRSLRTARWIESLGDADEPLRAISGVRTDLETPARMANASAVFTELHPSPMELHLPADAEPWGATLERVRGLRLDVPTGCAPLVTDELTHAARCAELACEIAIVRRSGGGSVQGLKARVNERIEEHRRLWLIRSRVGGLEESAEFWKSIEIEEPHDR